MGTQLKRIIYGLEIEAGKGIPEDGRPRMEDLGWKPTPHWDSEMILLIRQEVSGGRVLLSQRITVVFNWQWKEGRVGEIMAAIRTSI